jgi:hypothetical protein
VGGRDAEGESTGEPVKEGGEEVRAEGCVWLLSGRELGKRGGERENGKFASLVGLFHEVS